MNKLNNEIWQCIYKNVKSVVSLFTCKNEDKADLIHDALLHVYKRLKTSYCEKGKLDIWVKKVTLNFCKDRVTNNIKRNVKYYDNYDYFIEPHLSYQSNIENIKDKLAIELLYESISELNDIEQQIVTGRLNKESYLSLAKRLKKNKKTIIKHCKKSFSKLRIIINERFYEKYNIKYRDNVVYDAE